MYMYMHILYHIKYIQVFAWVLGAQIQLLYMYMYMYICYRITVQIKAD